MHPSFAPHLDCMYVIVTSDERNSVTSMALAYGSAAAREVFHDATSYALNAFSDPLREYHRALKAGERTPGIDGTVRVYRHGPLDVAAFDALAPGNRGFEVTEITSFRREGEPIHCYQYTGPNYEPYVFYVFKGDPENDDPGGYVVEVFEVSVMNAGAVESPLHFDVLPHGETVSDALSDAWEALTEYLRKAGELDAGIAETTEETEVQA